MDKNTGTIITQLLIKKKILAKEAIQDCFRQAEKMQRSPAPFLAKQSNLTEAQLLGIIAEEFQIACLDLKKVLPEKSLMQKVPVKIATYYKFVPIKLENHILTIAVACPLDVKMQDEIRTHLGFNIEIVLSCEEDVIEMLKKYYGLGADTVERILTQKAYTLSPPEQEAAQEVEDLESLTKDASVINLVNQIILEAYKKRATDIHIEPYRDKIRLRYRIDGILYDANVSPQVKRFLTPVLSRIKIMSRLDIVERRMPQDGRAIVKVQEQNLDLRVSFIPTPYGESVVIRILPTVMLFGLEKLGLSSQELKIFEELIKKPHGIIFLTGPTGSGKTTTLYACLFRINTNERKIITIEDPIEYEMEGITQIQVLPEIGLDFARGLRSMLRHDPDVMMVGEVRDLETAEIAIRVALTGHLVFSTLHTNDAASGATRLIDIGVDPYLVASSVGAFIAQRLVRLICPECRQEDNEAWPELKEQIAKELGYDDSGKIRFYRGKGCAACNFTGFFGRTAIYEILLINESIKEKILEQVSSDQIKRLAIANGMRTLRQSGWVKVMEGLTTPDEILRVSPVDEFSKESAKIKTGFKSKMTEIFNPDKDQSLILQKEPPKPSIEDKRIYARLDSRVYVRYKVFKQKLEKSKELTFEPELVGVTKNMSAGGLLFNASENINLGTVVDLTLELPEENPIQCLARTVRVEEVIPNKSYETAVCFLDLPNAERARLNRYVIRYSQ